MVKNSSFGKIGLMEVGKVYLRNFSNGECEYISLQEKKEIEKTPRI